MQTQSTVLCLPISLAFLYWCGCEQIDHKTLRLNTTLLSNKALFFRFNVSMNKTGIHFITKWNNPGFYVEFSEPKQKKNVSEIKVTVNYAEIDKKNETQLVWKDNDKCGTLKTEKEVEIYVVYKEETWKVCSKALDKKTCEYTESPYKAEDVIQIAVVSEEPIVSLVGRCCKDCDCAD